MANNLEDDTPNLPAVCTSPPVVTYTPAVGGDFAYITHENVTLGKTRLQQHMDAGDFAFDLEWTTAALRGSKYLYHMLTISSKDILTAFHYSSLHGRHVCDRHGTIT